jgi:hypothetical protein
MSLIKVPFVTFLLTFSIISVDSETFSDGIGPDFMGISVELLTTVGTSVGFVEF